MGLFIGQANWSASQIRFKILTHLFHLCAVELQISYFSPPGFRKNKVSICSKDGIHPNSIRGRELYCSALGSALFTARTTMDKGEKIKRKRRKKVKSR